MAYIGNFPAKSKTTTSSQYFNGDGSTVAFTLNRPVNVAEDLEVFVDNVQQEPGSGKSYTATGTSLTFDAAPSAGTANVYVVYRGLAEVTTRLEHDPNAALAATTGTFSGAVSGTTGTFSGFVGTSSTGALTLPAGTTAQRPSSPVNGMIRYNTTDDVTEEYRDGAWVILSNTFQASGGTETTYTSGSTNYKVHTFLSSASLSVTGPTKSVEYFIVAGGGSGGGGFASYAAGGGGGAGGMVTGTTTLGAGTYSITVAAGGAAVNGNNAGNAGGNSSFGSIASATGGGGGGSWLGSPSTSNAGDGGSGGGGANSSGDRNGGSGTTGQGNAGGSGITYSGNTSSAGGGGGGKGSVGANASGGTAGNGGSSATNDYRTGSNVYYAGGGGGGGGTGGTGGTSSGGNGGGTNTSGSNGTANTGGGGGGGGTVPTGSPSTNSGSGAGGIVVIRYEV